MDNKKIFTQNCCCVLILYFETEKKLQRLKKGVGVNGKNSVRKRNEMKTKIK